MTYAPNNLKAVRSLLLAHLNVDPDTVRSQDLEPAEVGIVGDTNHRGGYHCGSDRVVANDYSVVESKRDSEGLTLASAALDVGWFEVVVNGRTHNLYTFNRWIVAKVAAGEPDTKDIREIIYTPDGRSVLRWDRLKKRGSGDDSHLWHTHFSFFRDSIKAGRDQTPLFRRYLTSIGLLEDPDMPLTDADGQLVAKHVHNQILGNTGPSIGVAIQETLAKVRDMGDLEAKVDSLAAKVDALAATPPGTVTIPDDQLERVLRRVIGSVDGASPQA